MVTPGAKLMRAAVAVITLGLVSFVSVAIAAPPIPIEKRKFDHDRHVRAASASGKQADCKDCHRYDASGTLRGGKEHERCASCHTYPSSCSTLKQPGPKGPARVCEVCHVAKRRDCLPHDLPPPPAADSFTARFTHGKHLALGQSIEKDCAQCHQAQAPAGTPPVQAHKLCAGCHNPNGARPTMADCKQCHAAPVAKTAASSDPFRLAGFDHKNHHGKSRQASCLGCHDKLVGAGDAALPRPTMLGCQGKCHDGQKAFAAVGTSCTECHRGTAPPATTRPDVVFFHGAHAGRSVKINDCATCHSVESDGRLTPPLANKDHMPCAASGCHQAEFASRTPKICGVCHDQVAPWQHVTSRAREAATSEWYESIDHAAHLKTLAREVAGQGSNAACATCHGDKLAGGPRPGGHDGCVGCHGKGQAPVMSQCGACHVQEAPQRRAPSAWSVRPAFEKIDGHVKHAFDPRTKRQTSCTDCHAQVAKAKTLADVAPPAMNDCDGACHNGKIAFKTTGFGCARCHTRAAGGTPTALGERAREGAPGRLASEPYTMVSP